MKRVVSLALPLLPTDRLRRSDKSLPRDRPLIAARREGAKRIVVAADALALKLGLHPGMTVGHAQSLVANLLVSEMDDAADNTLLDRLARWAQRRYSPIVASDPPDGLIIDMAGAGHLWRDERAILDDLTGHLRRAGFAARAAIAPTRGAAWAVARCGEGGIVAPGETKAALGPLPLAALRLAPDTIAALGRVGFETVGQLYNLPRAPFALRYGSEPMLRLDHALGCAAEATIPVAPRQVPAERLAFVEPLLTAEALAAATARLCEALCARLALLRKGARRLDLMFHRVDGVQQFIRIGAARPVRDARHLTRLLLEKLDRVEPGFGIEAMLLSASLTERLDAKQIDGAMLATRERPADLSEMVDRLANRFGAASVYRIVPVESDVPERSARRVAPLAPPTGGTWTVDCQRPARLFDPPEAVETMALLPDHPPLHFTWRGRRHRVVAADGPERIHGEWWRRKGETLAVRDYFRIEDESGHRYWLFRRGDGESKATGATRWYIHGVFG
jgi:protein ImuB